MGDHPDEWHVMEVVGAQFRAAKSGQNKGKLTIKVKGTERRTYVTREEIQAAQAELDALRTNRTDNDGAPLPGGE